MILFKSAVVLVLLTSVVALTACSQDRPVTAYKPGVYKGKTDDLLQKSGPAMTEKLHDRFMMVQTDR
ncbi:MAG TPA: hypothetical protein VK138_06220 [Acidiferrobacterales bacterium]|nr:hypothetical protein [Acidiferrobacterales bacterium]